jgi:hypothetical protein
MVSCNNCNASIFKHLDSKFKEDDNLLDYEKEHFLHGHKLFFCSYECFDEFNQYKFPIEEINDDN